MDKMVLSMLKINYVKGLTTNHYLILFCCIYIKYTIVCNIWVCLRIHKISIRLKLYIKDGLPADPAEFSDLMN